MLETGRTGGCLKEETSEEWVVRHRTNRYEQGRAYLASPTSASDYCGDIWVGEKTLDSRKGSELWDAPGC